MAPWGRHGGVKGAPWSVKGRHRGVSRRHGVVRGCHRDVEVGAYAPLKQKVQLLDCEHNEKYNSKNKVIESFE